MDEDFILRNLLSQRDQTLPEVGNYQQMRLFDDSRFSDSQAVMKLLQS